MGSNTPIVALLLATRVAAATAWLPILGPVKLPGTVRVLIATTLGAALALGSPENLQDFSELTSTVLLVSVLKELVIGAGIALGFAASYAASQVAGRALDIQIGFGVSGVLNPATNVFSPLVGSILSMVLVAAFLSVDGHHQLIRALALSVQVAPPGVGAAIGGIKAVLVQTGAMFSFGLMLAAPVMFALLIVDLAMAIYARSMPQLNILVLSFSTKAMVAMIVLAISVQWMHSAFQEMFDSTFANWSTIGQLDE